MHWDRIPEASTRNYTCLAKNEETGENETIYFDLQAIHPEDPTINSSNFGNGTVLNVEPMDPFNLTCDFSGVPRPKLNWYKYENNERKALNFTDPNHMSLENYGKTLDIKFAKEKDEGRYECEAKYGEKFDQRSVTIEISKDSTSLYS